MRPVLVLAAMVLMFGVGFFFLDSRDELDFARTNLMGEWLGTGDTKFNMEFKESGKFVEARDGASPVHVSEGYWALFTKNMRVEGFKGPLEGGSLYLALGVPEGEQKYFQITQVDANTLELTDFKGGIYSFKKRR